MFILKQLRRKKNINQTDLAKAIGVSLRTVQLYEKRDANIPIKSLTKIAKYFDVSIAELYSQESVNETGSDYLTVQKSINGHTIKKLGPGKYLLNAPIVISESYESYTKNYKDSDYIAALPKIGFVLDQVSVGHYLAFEISNDSMNDNTLQSIPKQSIVLGKLIPISKVLDSLRKKERGPYVIVFDKAVMCKIITSYDKNMKALKCHSLSQSPEYNDFNIGIEEVDQIFRIVKKEIK